METKIEIVKEIKEWIPKEEFPPRGHLKPIKKWAGLFPQDPEEREGYFFFINQEMNREHQVIMSIPIKNKEDFWLPYEGDGDNTLAFHFASMDFKRMHGDNFDRYHCRLKKVFEKAHDLAQTHSCLSNPEGRENIRKRFLELVQFEFRNKLADYVEQYKRTSWDSRKAYLKSEIAKIGGHILRCKEIWEREAYAE